MFMINLSPKNLVLQTKVVFWIDFGATLGIKKIKISKTLCKKIVLNFFHDFCLLF